MARRRAFVPQRLPVFLACEGLSERGYGRWLSKLAVTHGMLVALRADDLGGGDPLVLVTEAIRKWKRADPAGGVFRLRALLLDGDRFGDNANRDELAFTRARKNRFLLIQQRPSHEAFLLRHFPRQQTRKPVDSKASLRMLKRVWPDYEKGKMDATHYERILSLAHLTRARSVEPELDRFLNLMGWK